MDAEHIEHTGDARELEHPDRDERAGLHERLRRLHRLMRRCHDEALVHDGPLSDTTRGRGRVLAALKMQSPIPTRELAYLLDIRQQSLNELLKKLQSDGLIERTPSEADRRVMMVALTGAGRNARIGGATDDYLDVLTDEETDTLSGLLDKLIDALKDRLGVDPDDEPARWMDDARRRMGEERFEVMMRMRQEGFGLGPFGDRGGHSRRERGRGRGGGGRRRGPGSDSFGECAFGDGERGFRSRRSPMAMAREGRFAGRRLRGGRGWNE